MRLEGRATVAVNAAPGGVARLSAPPAANCRRRRSPSAVTGIGDPPNDGGASTRAYAPFAPSKNSSLDVSKGTNSPYSGPDASPRHWPSFRASPRDAAGGSWSPGRL